MSAAEFLVEFSLDGGPMDGGRCKAALLPAGVNYLVTCCPEEGFREVWAYRFAERTDHKGRWILEPVCCVGHLGKATTLTK